MFAVVKDDEALPVADAAHQRLDDRPPRLLLHAQDRRHRLRHDLRVGERRELDEPDAVGIIVHDVDRDLQRQARLAEATGSSSVRSRVFASNALTSASSRSRR